MSTDTLLKESVPRVLYPLDETGTKEQNFIKGELHTVSLHTDRDVKVIIPTFAPFFTDDFKLVLESKMGGPAKELVLGVDYKFILMYRGATERLGKGVYGGIAFDNLCLDGVVAVDYRTLGGDQIMDTKRILKEFIEYNHNPRTSDWEYLNNTPCSYNPGVHDHDLKDVIGMDELVAVLHLIANNIAIGNTALVDRIDKFLNNFDFCKFEQLVHALNHHSFLELIERMKELENQMDSLKVFLMYEKYLEIIEALDKYSFADLVARMDRLEIEFKYLKENLDIDGIRELLEPMDERLTKIEKTLILHEIEINKLKGLNKEDISYLRGVVDALSDSYCDFMNGYNGVPLTMKEIAEDIEKLKARN